jgi:hypothetical protein
MSDDGKPAVFLGTMLADGTTVAVCDECLVMFCASMLETMTGVDPAPFLRAISEDVDTADPTSADAAADEAPADGFEEDPPPAPGRAGRIRDKSLVAGTDADPPADPLPAETATATPET